LLHFVILQGRQTNMVKVASAVVLGIGLVLVPSWPGQRQTREEACVQRCYTNAGDPEMDRQEIVSLEKEGAHAIQLNDGSFFRRIYSDEFTGTLSHGQQVNKVQWIQAIESPLVKRESFTASDIKVRIFENTAIVTCLWSSRFVFKGQTLSSQMRSIHVYVSTTSGWRVFSGQSTNLPPDVQQPL
jgi:ketosteroid isomerase-like protein